MLVLFPDDEDHDPHFSIANASVERFAVSAAPNATAAAFSYDIRAAVKLYNSYGDITYDLLAANFYFNGTQFAGRTIAPFDQGLGETAVLHADVAGSVAERGSLALVDEFERGSRTGDLDLELRLDSLYHSSFGNPKVKAVRCPLAVRLVSAVDTIECEVTKGEVAAKGEAESRRYMN
ncbi:uncharacterized protein LOC109717033 [Ananas comosus]|uniref:Uncharacterized protein LOC109717033 n=1 Tax=Ananas comosus TaxID=4615 RepID=A0A6P5FXQ9_ANACO|nr:uncharacterized protein LOC109717033 [Ananas comosus]